MLPKYLKDCGRMPLGGDLVEECAKGSVRNSRKCLLKSYTSVEFRNDFFIFEL